MNVSRSIQNTFIKSFSTIKTRKGILYVSIFILALIAFEAFNFSTTEFALSDLLGDLDFAGLRWATLLSIAFCGIDFAGIARLFTPQTGEEEPRSVWFMFGAWFLAGTMNTILTWWGVVMAMQSHSIISAGAIDSSFVNKVVPIFIALMVWVIRILLVGTLSKKGDQLLHESGNPGKSTLSRRELRQAQSRVAHPVAASTSFKSAPKIKPNSNNKRGFRPEPTYIPMQEDMAFHSFKGSGTGQKRA